MISVFLTFLQSVAQLNTEKAVSLIQRNMSLIYGQRKNFFELKKVLLIQKKFLWLDEIDLFTLKKNVFESTEIFFN